MIFKAKWFSHVEEEKVTCICKEGSNYWTIIIAPTKSYIFIITVFPSNSREVSQFRNGKELNAFELSDNGNKMKCPECKHQTVIDKEPMTFKFNPNVIVQEVAIDRCTNCGFESVSEDEYERVRKMVHEVKAPRGATVVLA